MALGLIVKAAALPTLQRHATHGSRSVPGPNHYMPWVPVNNAPVPDLSCGADSTMHGLAKLEGVPRARAVATLIGVWQRDL